MNLLLNDVLVCRVIRIQNLDRLPPSLALRRVRALNRKRCKQRRQCTSLGVHTRLDKLLGAAQVRVAVDHCPGAGHRGDPEAKEQRVSVLGCPFFGALEAGLILLEEGCAVALALDFGPLLGVVFDVEFCGGAVRGDDSYEMLVWSRRTAGELERTNEGSCRCDEESAEW